MKKSEFMFSLCLLLFPIIMCSCKNDVSYNIKNVIDLNEGWSFSMKGDTQWLPAKVPGCVHTDLLMNNRIPEPFFRDNEKSLQWIDKHDWIYRCVFTIDSNHLSHREIFMQFQGLDTYARIVLNNKLILETDNMFRSWKTDVKPFLIEGENTIEIEFKSPIKVGLEKLEQLGYGLPAVNDQSENGELGDRKVSVFTRKAPYHYGWDWGPRFVTSGIWRPIELVFSNNPRLENVYFKQNFVTNDIAQIETVAEINALEAGKYEITIESGTQKSILAKSSIHLEPGLNTLTLPITIRKPELWWPNGMGKQILYDFKTILTKDNTILDTLTRKIGLRSIRLVQEPDSAGRSYYFEINGKPMFAKGANYIPNDNFLNRVSEKKYTYIIQSAVNANMNMLRVWGGGIYENDIFYKLCDGLGILVWQDFMFACSMYPGDNAFLENVRQEAIENVKRLRNHACIALWCGNNEIDAAWCNGDPNCGWNWKQKYSTKQQQDIWHSYDTLFYRILPDIIEKYDGLRAYWPSSPLAGFNEHANYSSNSGDIHYWGVWHGNEPFSSFFKHIGRFMSEYGFQSFPDFQSIRKFSMQHDWDFQSDVMLSHQRSGYGNGRIIDYMEDLYPVPEGFEEKIYVGQILQAEAIKQAINAHRASKPYCMGSLYWQLNDCWPAASWSSIDYYSSWKALHYYVKKAYEPITLSFIPKDGSISIVINSDLCKNTDAQLRYSIIDFAGKVLESKNIAVIINCEKSTNACILNEESVKQKYNTHQIFLHAQLISDDKEIVSDNYYFEIPKNLKLPKTEIQVLFKQEGNKLKIDLTSNKLAKNVYLSFPGFEPWISDNYFDILPGESKSITCQLPETVTLNRDNLKIMLLNDIIDK
jgi:beta-mannosidase